MTLYYGDDNKEVFSSFERFTLYDHTKLCATENVHIEYNFFIVLPKTKSPRPYKLSIDILSTAAVRQRFAKESGVGRFFMGFPGQTGRFEIEYIDYAVAKSFHTTIEHWFQALPNQTKSKFMEMLQNHSHNFPMIFKLITASVVGVFVYYNAIDWIKVDSSDLQLAKLGIFSFSVIFVASGIAYLLGKWAERSADSVQPISYLKLNRGDERAYTEAVLGNRNSIVGFILSSTLMIALNIASAYLAFWIGVSG